MSTASSVSLCTAAAGSGFQYIDEDYVVNEAEAVSELASATIDVKEVEIETKLQTVEEVTVLEESHAAESGRGRSKSQWTDPIPAKNKLSRFELIVLCASYCVSVASVVYTIYDVSVYYVRVPPVPGFFAASTMLGPIRTVEGLHNTFTVNDDQLVTCPEVYFDLIWTCIMGGSLHILAISTLVYVKYTKQNTGVMEAFTIRELVLIMAVNTVPFGITPIFTDSATIFGCEGIAENGEAYEQIDSVSILSLWGYVYFLAYIAISVPVDYLCCQRCACCNQTKSTLLQLVYKYCLYSTVIVLLFRASIIYGSFTSGEWFNITLEVLALATLIPFYFGLIRSKNLLRVFEFARERANMSETAWMTRSIRWISRMLGRTDTPELKLNVVNTMDSSNSAQQQQQLGTEYSEGKLDS